MLIFRGVSWLLTVGRLWVVIPALIAGTVKSLFILDNTARKGVRRILEMADGRCLGAVYSILTWLLVLVMMGAGMALRRSALPREILGGLYVAIGWALFFSSRLAWLAWIRISDQHNKQ
jgi:carbon starvation protein CstA